MITFFVILFAATFVAFVLPQFKLVSYSPKFKSPERPKTTMIRLFDGPNDGEVHELAGETDKLPHYFVAPYVPMDENGMPDPDEDHVIHHANGVVYVKPNFAYYQQVTDEDYFYVRDIDENEVQKLQRFKELPTFKKAGD